MRTMLTSMLAVSALAACSGERLEQPAPGAATPAVTALTTEAGNVWLGSSGFTARTRLVIRSQGEWASAWATLWSPVTPVPDLPAVDFDRETVLVAAMGSRSTGGYGIRISVTSAPSADSVIASVKESSPGQNCVVGQAESEPATAVVLQGTPAQVEFSEAAVVVDCD